MIRKNLIFILITIVFIACNDNDYILKNENVIINKNLYNKTQTNNYTIKEVNLHGDLLTIKINSVGCNGETWKVILVDANEILESNPIQRNLKILLENKELCYAIVEKEFTFNIKKLKENQSHITLNLEGWNSKINY